jgi:ferredoxin-nitrite reductase
MTETKLNPIERIKAEGNGLEILEEIETLAAEHGGWETLEPKDRERLKWVGTFFRKPPPGKFMMRIRINNGQVTSRQLRALAKISIGLGNGVIDLTTRQQVELRGIQLSDLPKILETLDDVDLTSLQTGIDNIRGVTTCALAGITPNELFDAAPMAEEFTQTFLGNREYTDLPRKLNIGITGCLDNCTHTETQDISMTPAINDAGEYGFNVAVGGKMGSGGMAVAKSLNVFVPPADAAKLAAAITLLFRDEGQRQQRTKARLAFLVAEWGIDAFRDAVEERFGAPLAPAGSDARGDGATDHLGVEPQRQPGLFSVGLCVPTGRTSATQVLELARLADTYGTGGLRLTIAQNVIITDVLETSVDKLLDEPLLGEFMPDADAFARGLVACTGTDYCNLGLIETKSISKALVTGLAERFPGAAPITMNWSGCVAGCGNHHAADIGFQGAKTRENGEVVDAVNIFLGGRTGTSPEPAEKIMELVPVSMLDELMPSVLERLDTLKKTRNDQLALLLPTV